MFCNETFYIGNVFRLPTLVIFTRKKNLSWARNGYFFLCISEEWVAVFFLNLILFGSINVYVVEMYKRLPVNSTAITEPSPPFVVQSACRVKVRGICGILFI